MLTLSARAPCAPIAITALSAATIGQTLPRILHLISIPPVFSSGLSLGSSTSHCAAFVAVISPLGIVGLGLRYRNRRLSKFKPHSLKLS